MGERPKIGFRFNSVKNTVAKSAADGQAHGSQRRIRWFWGVLAGCAMILLSQYPQCRLWLIHGERWDAIAYNQGLGDEVAYAAYINALIEGRPRRNDPYTGRDDRPNAPQSESLFSIQFIPAYAVALPARALGVSATTALIVLTPVMAFASSLAIFWLLAVVTGSERLAAAGAVVVLCCGALAAAEGAAANLAGANAHFDYFPFLRRYQPAASFPLFPVFCALVWRSLTQEQKRFKAAILAGAIFALLVFSYFYLWTAVAAWLLVLGILWLILRAPDRISVLRLLAVFAVVATSALIPYLILISNRSETTESVQAFVLSRRPDLFSAPELIGALVLLVLTAGALRRSIDLRDRRVIFAASFALIPFIVLNQQIITGRVMQPIHYKGFVANYSVLLAIVITGALGWRRGSGESWQLTKRALLWVAVAALEWGCIETYQAANKSADANNKGVADMAVYVRLNEQARSSRPNSNEQVVLFSDPRAADGAPAVSPFAVLWAPHMLVYTSTTTVESKERLYRQLYYTGFGARELEAYFHGSEVYYGYAAGMFGFDRIIDGLNSDARPISRQELNDETLAYTKYAESFDRDRASNPKLSYVVTPIGDEPNLSNLDRWYERDAGERVGKFKLYRVKLRNQEFEDSLHLSDEHKSLTRQAPHILTGRNRFLALLPKPKF
jgi:hypothetical protein